MRTLILAATAAFSLSGPAMGQEIKLDFFEYQNVSGGGDYRQLDLSTGFDPDGTGPLKVDTFISAEWAGDDGNPFQRSLYALAQASVLDGWRNDGLICRVRDHVRYEHLGGDTGMVGLGAQINFCVPGINAVIVRPMTRTNTEGGDTGLRVNAVLFDRFTVAEEDFTVFIRYNYVGAMNGASMGQNLLVQSFWNPFTTRGTESWADGLGIGVTYWDPNITSGPRGDIYASLRFSTTLGR